MQVTVGAGAEDYSHLDVLVFRSTPDPAVGVEILRQMF